MSLIITPIHRITLRVVLFMGGDREMVLTSGAISAALIFAAQSFIAAFYAVLLWSFTVWVFRLIAKSDALMRHVYLRHLRYQKYYAPRSTPFHQNNTAFAKRFR